MIWYLLLPITITREYLTNISMTSVRHPMAIRRERMFPDVIDISRATASISDSSSTDVATKTTNQLVIDTYTRLIQVTKERQKMMTQEDAKKTRFRLSQYSKVIRLITDYEEIIVDGDQLKDVKGVGKGTISKINEIIETGTLTDLADDLPELVSSYHDSDLRVINELKQFHGIGDAIAKRLIAKFHITGTDDFVNKYNDGRIGIGKNQISKHIAVGIEHFRDIQQKIPYDEIRHINHFIQSAVKSIDSKLRVIICGSHRRKMPLSGDIDMLITHKDIITDADVENSHRQFLIDIVDQLTKSKFLVGHLTVKGHTKYMGVCHTLIRSPCGEKYVTLNGIGRRIDIRFVPYVSYYPSMLYFTGCGEFNVRMRIIANQRGFTLNEYGLFLYDGADKGDIVERITSERDIFDIIGIKYIRPRMRT